MGKRLGKGRRTGKGRSREIERGMGKEWGHGEGIWKKKRKKRKKVGNEQTNFIQIDPVRKRNKQIYSRETTENGSLTVSFSKTNNHIRSHTDTSYLVGLIIGCG